MLSTTNAGHVNYNALQSELNMRARRGLTFQGSHVWTKGLGNIGGDGNLNLSYRGAFQRPDCVSGANANLAANGSMFSARAFNPIPSGPVGNCGVGILLGPGTSTVAAALAKNFFLSERFRLRFEATFTNLMNHPNFAPPPANVTASSFGVVQNVQSAENSGNRTGQISLRLDF